jgi:hypothetical protein
VSRFDCHHVNKRRRRHVQANDAITTERLVSEADYIDLNRLVIERGWRVDNGRADTVRESHRNEIHRRTYGNYESET